MKVEDLRWKRNEKRIVWSFESQEYQIETKEPAFSVVQMEDGVSLAIVFSNIEFGTNNAFIYDAKGNIRYKLSVPEIIINPICFHEIYYINQDLTAIIATNQCDFACVIDESTYDYKKVYETR